MEDLRNSRTGSLVLHSRHIPPPFTALLLLGLLGIGTLVGCSHGDSSAPPPPTTTAPPDSATTATLTSTTTGASGSPTTTTAAPSTDADAQSRATLAAWRRYWDVYIAVGAQMHLPDARLAEVATGNELRTLGGAFLAAKSGGEVLRGTIDLNPRIVSVANGTATLRDCYHSEILGYKNNQPIGPADPRRRLVAATLVLGGGTWKVSAIEHLSDGCTAP